MGDTLAQDCFPMPEPFLGAHQFRGELIEVGSTKVLEFAPFEQIPDSHLGIEFGGVARQSFQMKASGSAFGQEIFDGTRAMNARAIPDDQQLPWDLAQKQLQEAHHIRSFERLVLDVHDQAPIQGETTDDRSDDHESVAPSKSASAPQVRRCAPPWATSKSPPHLQTRSCVPPLWPFF